MQYFVVLALIAAVVSAAVIKPAVVAGELAQIQEIVAAINHPSTDPATAVLLEQLLYETLGLPAPSPVVVGPAIVDSFEPIAIGPVIVDSFEPIAVGPVIVDEFEPVAVGPAIIPPIVVDPSPVIVPPVVNPVEETPAAASFALVQIIINVNSAAADVPAVYPAAPETIIDVPHPVQVVDVAPIVPEPVQVVEVAPEPVQIVDLVPEPVQVVDLVPEPVQVVEPALPVLPEPVVIPEPILPEPVQVAKPVIPVDPAITLPEELN